MGMDQQPPLKLWSEHRESQPPRTAESRDPQGKRGSPGREARAYDDESKGSLRANSQQVSVRGLTFKNSRSSINVREKFLHDHGRGIRTDTTLECSGALCIPLQGFYQSL